MADTEEVAGAAWCEVGDAYGGVSVDCGELALTNDFASTLGGRMSAWKRSRKRGIWLRIPISRAVWIPSAASLGFEFHHAERDHVVMTTWLAEERNQLPSNASHQMGVGAVVLDADGRLALVKERFGRQRWKVPTGLVEARETIADAVVREVREEIGLRTTFVKVIAIKHSHRAPFGKSDAFFLCLLHLADKNSSVPEFHIDPLEIHDATWLSWEDYRELDQPKEWKALFDLCDQVVFRRSADFVEDVRLDNTDTVIYRAGGGKRGEVY